MNKTILISVFLSVVLSFGIGSVFFNQTTPSEKPVSETAYDRIQRTRTLRCGYAFIDGIFQQNKEKHSFSGPAYDIITTMADNLKLKVEWVTEVGFASVAEDLKRGRYDMLCITLGTNAARGQVMDKSRNVFFMPAYLYVQANEKRSKSDLSWVNDPSVTLSSIDGTIFNSLYAHYFPKARLVTLPELSPFPEQMLQVSTGKADATVSLLHDAVLFMKQNPGSLKTGSDLPVIIFPASFWMPKGDYPLKGMIDSALDEMIHNGTVNRILSSYETNNVSYYWRLLPEYITPATIPSPSM